MGGKWQAVDTVQTERGARTMTIDPRTRRIYLLAAEYGPPQAGDKVLLSGTIGDHGFAVLVARGDLRLDSTLESDTAPLNGLTARLVELGPRLRWMRDPTRGGLATALNELASATGLAVRRIGNGPGDFASADTMTSVPDPRSAVAAEKMARPRVTAIGTG